MPSIIRMCHDMLPSLSSVGRFSRLAVQENANNVVPGLDSTPVQGRLLPMSIAFVYGKKWQPGRTLRVAFLDGDSSRKNLVKRVAPEWSKYCSITFDFDAAPGDAEIRISFRQTGAWSYIGTDCLGIPRGQPTMNYGFIDEGTILHEFGHALGCIHEHQHPQAGIPWNTQAVYRYYGGPPNNWNRQTVDVNIFRKYGADITQYSKYDPKSIMHYPIDAQLLTDPSKAVGWNRSLSAIDMEYVGRIYPKSGTDGGDDGGEKPPVDESQVQVPASGSYRIIESGGKRALVFNP